MPDIDTERKSAPLSLYQYLNLATYAAQKVPGVASSAVRYLTLGPRQGQEDCDLRTVVAVSLLKSLTADSERASVERAQALSNRITPVPKNLWGIRTKFDLPDGRVIEDAVDAAIRSTKPDDIAAEALPRSCYAPCSGEWQAMRRYKGPIDDLSAQEKFNLMQENCTDKETVLLYLHGGAHYLGNETGHREFVAHIASQFGGKAYALRYRKSPQAPFPAALTDALSAYEYLINPPPGALHKAIDPKNIVLAGDSAGGNLAAALMEVLIEARSQWSLPAGMILISPWVDLTHSLPSCSHGPNDYLPEMTGAVKSHRPSRAWAADGKQRQFYCFNEMVTHPLVSPMAYDGWRDSPAAMIVCGAEERLRDEGRYLAQVLSEEKVPVQFEEFQSMPHVFQMLSLAGPAAKLSMASMGEFVRQVVHSAEIVPSRRVWRNSRGDAKPFEKSELKVYTREQIKLAMATSRDNFGKPFKSVL